GHHILESRAAAWHGDDTQGGVPLPLLLHNLRELLAGSLCYAYVCTDKRIQSRSFLAWPLL
ncbi:MAG TPA: hypothetical protein VJO15_03660, partial [Dehalococcoidia bacterium]|nr:hypothetical protein [Dehalococcoidia bacterium]